jgi:hypothetical protein
MPSTPQLDVSQINATPKSAASDILPDDGRITIGLSDAQRMRSELVAQRRAALAMELNAKRVVEHSTKLIAILDLITETSAL